MPTTQHDEPCIKTLEYVATASWHCHGVPLSTDPAATAFGPAQLVPAGFAWSPSGAVAPPLQQVTKQVLYIPVKKQSGQETFPALRIHLGVLEVGRLRNVCVPGHRGAKVELNVWNVWGNPRRGPVKLQGALDANDECDVVIPPDQVQSWLDPTAELGGRVNELLLDFDFTLPTLKGLKGESSTRVYLYRRKVIVFLPGVFGSQLRVKMPDGTTLGFPDFYAEPAHSEPLEPLGSDYALLKQLGGHAWNQKVGGLECDAAGRPLIQPIQPTLLRVWGKAYDVYDDCRSARMQYFSGVPEAFRLVELQVFAYDWRTDLTECAKELAVKLEALQAHLRSLPDVDDEVALAGHSTGGLIMRRALGEPGMQAIVSHAFFISVPFLGAPKALSVILTGQDPPGGESMILFVTADSLRDGALSMPIVYHLAPSAAYPERVAFTPSRPAGAPHSIEDDKRDLIESAINAGFRPRPRFVKAGAGSDVDRALLAASADDWHAFWAEASERMRAQELYDAMFPRGYPERDGWMPEQIKSRRLEGQYAARVTGGWNTALAARAERFHRESLEISRSEAWAEKSYVFYSIDRSATTLSVHLERVSEVGFAGPIDLLKDENIPVLRFLDGQVEPPRGEEEQILGKDCSVPAPTVHQWTRANGQCRKVVWRLWGRNADEKGDGTVPLESLVGFGGSARFAPPITEGRHRAHADTPKEGSIWLLIMRSLQGTWAPAPISSDDALRAIRTENG